MDRHRQVDTVGWPLDVSQLTVHTDAGTARKQSVMAKCVAIESDCFSSNNEAK
jgi:hypothetical protein